MKKILAFLLCSVMILSLVGCASAKEKNESTPQSQKTESLAEQLTAKDNITVEQNKVSAETESKNEVDITVETNDTKSENVESKITEVKPTTSQAQANTKSITVNGKIYTADFTQVTKSSLYSNGDRELEVYKTNDSKGELQYDKKTGDLLFASFSVQNNPEGKLTQDEAKSIAEKFIKAQCDFSQYTLDKIGKSEIWGYECVYSKHIDGYVSSQKISFLITFDGEFSRFSENKFIFEGIDTNIKIDINKVNSELDKKIKNLYGESANYDINIRYVDVDSEGSLVMKNAVYIFEEDDTDYIEFRIPLNKATGTVK